MSKPKVNERDREITGDVASAVRHTNANRVGWVYPEEIIAAYREEVTGELIAAIEDHIEWTLTGKVDGVGFDEASALDALQNAIAKAEGREG